MKRPISILLTCICVLTLAMLCLSACGGGSDGSSGASQNGASGASADTENGDGTAGTEMSEESVHSAFEQALMGMSEYYRGTTPFGEEVFYAGGSDGENAVFVLVVPDSTSSVIFTGPAEVGDDNVLTITDTTSGSSISFQVFDNGDGTYSFSMGDDYGAAVMSKCSAAEIVDALTSVVMGAAALSASSGTTGEEAGSEGTTE